VNYLKTQKTVVRVSPEVPLRNIIPAICEKCEVSQEHVVLLRDSITGEELELTKSLEELGIKELYAWDRKRGELRLKAVTAGLDAVPTLFWFVQRAAASATARTAACPAVPGCSRPRARLGWPLAGLGRRRSFAISWSCHPYRCVRHRASSGQSLSSAHAVGWRGRKRRRAIVMAAVKAERQRRQSRACEKQAVDKVRGGSSKGQSY